MASYWKSIASMDGKLVRIWVIGPPLDNSGGIGSLFTYAKTYFPNNYAVSFYDTRGYTKQPIYSIVPLSKVLFLIVAARLRNNLDLVHVNVGGGLSLCRKALVVFLCTYILKIPTSIHFHGSDPQNSILGKKNRLGRFFLNCVNSCNAVIILGSKTHKELIEIGVHRNKLKVLRMGVPDLQKEVANKTFNFNPRNNSDPIILFAGELSSRKGLLETLQSLSDQKLKNTYLIVAGGGNVDTWKKTAVEIGVDNRVAFIGLRSYSEIHQYFGIVDGIILASKAEGLPVSVMECFSAGKIPIINLSGNLIDVATESNAIIISLPVTSKIIEALVKFNSLLNSQEYYEFSKNSRETWREYFNVEETTMALAQLWAKILDEGQAHET